MTHRQDGCQVPALDFAVQRLKANKTSMNSMQRAATRLKHLSLIWNVAGQIESGAHFYSWTASWIDCSISRHPKKLAYCIGRPASPNGTASRWIRSPSICFEILVSWTSGRCAYLSFARPTCRMLAFLPPSVELLAMLLESSIELCWQNLSQVRGLTVDGSCFISASRDRTVKVWAETGPSSFTNTLTLVRDYVPIALTCQYDSDLTLEQCQLSIGNRTRASVCAQT